MEWTPLITADFFTGMKADVLTTVTGVLGVFVIIVGVGFIVKVFSR